MSEYSIINLGDECRSHFITIEHGEGLISLSIYTGHDYQKALLIPEQVLDLTDMLLSEVSAIRTQKSQEQLNKNDENKI